MLLSAGYSFQIVAKLGDALPNRADGVFTSDFEVGALNNRGQISFTSEQGKPDTKPANDLGEGAFLTGPKGNPIKTLALPGGAAPGGGTFGGGVFGRNALNAEGDAAFASTLNGGPVLPGAGATYVAGLYRYSHETGTLAAVVAPGVTVVPGAGALQGAYINPSLNNRGDLTFVGVVSSNKGAFPKTGLAEAVFKVDEEGHITELVAPGDPAPGGSTFDGFQNTSINQRGDVAFGAHVASDTSLGTDLIGLGDFQSVYLRHADGTIVAIAHQGSTVPASAGGGVFDNSFSPQVNDRGQVAFQAPLLVHPGAPDPAHDPVGIFLYSQGTYLAVARPGQAMPGGGHFVSASPSGSQSSLDDRGQVVFGATLDNGQQGVFAFSNGALSLVAKSGTALPGGRSIMSLDQFGSGDPIAWPTNNNRGQVAFAAVLDNGSTAMLVATPQGQHGEDSQEQLAEINGSHQTGNSDSDADDQSHGNREHEGLFAGLGR